MAGNTDLPDDMQELGEADRSEDEHSANSSEPSYFSYGPLLDPSVPSPSRMSYPPSSGNSRNPHRIRSIEVQVSALGESFLAFYHRNSHHTENTWTTESIE